MDRGPVGLADCTYCTAKLAFDLEATFARLRLGSGSFSSTCSSMAILGDGCHTFLSRPHRRRPRVGVSPRAALAAAALMLPLGREGADAFVASPQLLSAAAAASGRRGVESRRTSPRGLVGMVSGAVGASSASVKEGDHGGVSLGERLRADFPILDQVCTGMHTRTCGCP